MRSGKISSVVALLALFCGTLPLAAETFDFDGCTVTYSGATVTTVSGEKVLKFTQSGTLSVSSDVRADILVVGGGGGGGSAYYKKSGMSKSSYNGNGGNGGVVSYATDRTLSANTEMAVTVGSAGTGGAAAANGSTANSGSAGGTSSVRISSSENITASGGAGGSGGTSSKNNQAGSAGSGSGSYDISGTKATYGSSGSKAPSSGSASDVTAANGQGGQGGRASSQQTSRKGGKGGAGIVIVRLKEVLIPRTPIDAPVAATGLIYAGVVQTGVAAGDHYTLGGKYQAKDAGSYTATATPADGYCWTDGTYGEISLTWSITRRPVTVSVMATSKTAGEEEPAYQTQAEGFVDGDVAEVAWKVWRTALVEQPDGTMGLDESVGTYDLAISGTTETANYTITYEGGVGAFEIVPPIIEIAVPSAGTGFVYDGKPKTGVAAGEGYTLSGTITATDAGEYSVTATLREGYCWADGSTDAKMIAWSIAKATYDMSGVAFPHKATVYNGQVQPISVTGLLPDGVTVAYEDNTNKNVGAYMVTAKFTGDTKNHNSIPDLTAMIAIEPLVITVTPTAGQSKIVGEEYAIAYETDIALVEGDVFTGALTATDAVGEQPILQGTLAIDDGNEGGNYTLTVVETVTITIKRPPPSISDDEGEVEYDPTTNEVVVKPEVGVTEVEIVNMPEGATAKVPATVDTVKGVTSDQVIIMADATNETGSVSVDITGAFTITETASGVTIALNEDPAAEVEVEIAGVKETIKVTPELTEAGDTMEPLTVTETTVGLGAKTIPGLVYSLKRRETLDGVSKEVACERAKGMRLKLTDPMEGEKPSQAFYVIEVRK